MEDSIQAGLRNAPSPLVTPTYDGSGQVVHPGIAYFPNSWHGFNYWLVVTPYPKEDASKENPSILVSNDGASWDVPPGLANPIVFPSGAHLADADLFYDESSGQLWVYYLDLDLRGLTHLSRKTSSDGITWHRTDNLFKVLSHQLVSPTIEKVENTYFMWSVNAGAAGCSANVTTVEYRTSQNGIDWSAPQAALISQPGYTIWHIEVVRIPSKNEYWMLSAAYPNESNCGKTVLFFARSADGINWMTYSKIALATGSGWDAGEIYRSTLLYEEEKDLLKVWYSARGGKDWHLGYSQANYSTFLSRLQR